MKRNRPEPDNKAGGKKVLNVKESVYNVEFLLDTYHCEICKKEISRSVVIICAQCGIFLCLPCLISGKEKDEHKKTDDYYVLDSLRQSIFSPDWSIREELMLVKGIHLFKYRIG
jgi:hypothetical protein